MMEKETKFKQTEIGMIPEDWKVEEIREVAEVVGGGTPSTKISEYWNGDIAWITPRDLSTFKFRYIKRGERNITKNGLENSSAKLLPKGTVLLTTRAPVGYLAIADNQVTTNQGFRSLIPNNKSISEFLFYLLKRNVEILKSNASGTTFGELSGSRLKALQFAFPDVEEQQSIAKILSDLDDKIELNQKMNKTLEAIGQAIFKHWFVDFEFPNEEGKPYKSSGGKMIDSELGKEIPKGWRVVKIRDIIKLNKRGISPNYVNEGVPVINQKCIRDFRIIDEDIKFQNKEDPVPDYAFIKPFDILINSMGVGTLGRIAQISTVREKKMIHSCISIVRADPEKIHPLILGYYFKNIQSQIENMGEGTTGQTSLKNKLLDEIDFVLPSKDIQNKISHLFEEINYRIDENIFEISILSQIRDAILPKLMSGKMRVPLEEKE